MTSFSPYHLELINKDFPVKIPAYIEVSKNSRFKYEWDDKLNTLVLDRILHSSVVYPYNYGFFPQTLCDDGDPLDVLVMCDGELLPGSVVFVRPICYMIMEDEKGQDEKVLAVVDKDPRLNEIQTMNDIPKHIIHEITNFFETYKILEKDKWVKVGDWKNKEETLQLIKDSYETYKNL
jgi:inorganic pyrophosphatase